MQLGSLLFPLVKPCLLLFSTIAVTMHYAVDWVVGLHHQQGS